MVHAWRGSWTRANELAALLGGFVLAVLLWLFSPELREKGLVYAPTTYWGTAALAALMAAASVVLAFAVIFVYRLVLAPVNLFWSERAKVDDLQLKVKQNIADMTIQEVFFHIDADVIEFQRTQELGQTIIDCLSTSQITAYGRQSYLGNRQHVGYSNLAKIPVEFWKTAEFTYDFFGENREQDLHAETKSPSVGPAYRDLRFNLNEINLRWPKSNSSGRIFAAKAIYIILSQSEWAKKRADNPDSMQSLRYEDTMNLKQAIKRRLLSEFKRDLRDQLRAGHIDTWGRVDRHHPLVQIKKEEWDKIEIAMDEYDLRNLQNGFCSSFSGPGAARSTCYENVVFSKTQIFKVYPLLKEPFWIDG